MKVIVDFFINAVLAVIVLAVMAVAVIFGGWLLMVVFYKGSTFIASTEWWQGLIATHSHVVAIVILGFILMVYSVFHCIVFRGEW